MKHLALVSLWQSSLSSSLSAFSFSFFLQDSFSFSSIGSHDMQGHISTTVMPTLPFHYLQTQSQSPWLGLALSPLATIIRDDTRFLISFSLRITSLTFDWDSHFKHYGIHDRVMSSFFIDTKYFNFIRRRNTFDSLKHTTKTPLLLIIFQRIEEKSFLEKKFNTNLRIAEWVEGSCVWMTTTERKTFTSKHWQEFPNRVKHS